MVKGRTRERRKYPRADIDFRGVIETAGQETIELRARNISATGMYFTLPVRLETFTEVAITVALPATDGGRGACFKCQGVIVRVDELDDGIYGVAVHFTFIEEDCRQAIISYVDHARRSD